MSLSPVITLSAFVLIFLKATEASLLVVFAFFTDSIIPFITSAIVAAFSEVFSARFLISSATTANPFPASPACADSIAAFIERRSVCSATLSIISITSFT